MFNPHNSDWLINKFTIYGELRSRDTAYYSEKYKSYIITRYADVISALKDSTTFASGKGNLVVESPKRFGNTLGASDGAKHDLLKNIVKNAYSKESIGRIVDSFEIYADTLLDGNKLPISEIIEHMSAWITAEILNLPMDKHVVKNFVFDIQRHAPQTTSVNVDPTSYDDFLKVLLELIRNREPATGPGIYKEFMDNISDSHPYISLFTGPCISGASSMTGALQFLTLDLYRENQLDLVLSDRDLIPNAINESLRFHASTGRFSRTVTTDTVLHGINLKPDDRVILCLDSANRDSAMFDNPNQFDLNRNTQGHLAFGYGAHACIALAISKAIMGKYLNMLLDKYGKYKITTDNENYNYFMTASGNNDMITNLIIEKQ